MDKTRFAPLRRELKDARKIAACAKEFGVVGDATRLKICYLLCRHPELSVSQIAQVLNVSISTVSHSLARLRSISLVKTRRDSQTIYYSLARSPLSKLLRGYLRV